MLHAEDCMEYVYSPNNIIQLASIGSKEKEEIKRKEFFDDEIDCLYDYCKRQMIPS